MPDSPEQTGAPKAARPTRSDERDRVELCRKLLALRASECDVERAAMQQFGVGRRKARRYLALARRAMSAAAGRSRDEHVAEAYAFYGSLIADRHAKDADRLKAQERIEKLLGLDPASAGESAEFDGETVSFPWLANHLHGSAPPPQTPPRNCTGE